MADEDLVYLLRRAREERQRAAESQDNPVRLVHALLADAYERRLREGKIGHLRVTEG